MACTVSIMAMPHITAKGVPYIASIEMTGRGGGILLSSTSPAVAAASQRTWFDPFVIGVLRSHTSIAPAAASRSDRVFDPLAHPQ